MSRLIAAIVLVTLLYLPAQSQADTRRGAEWASRSSMPGINVLPLYPLGWNSTSWAASVATSAHLDDIAAQGYQWIRIPFNPTDILTATSTQSQDLQIAILRNAIQTWVSRGRKVLLDAHTTADVAGWTYTDISNDYPSGPKWLRYRVMTQRIMMMLRQFPSDLVAYQQWNEISGVVSGWTLQMQNLQSAGRSSGNRNTWMLISGDQFSSPAGLTELTTAGFDVHSLWGVTPYTWQQVWIQGLNPSGGTAYFVYGTGSGSALSFPPIPSEATAAKAAITVCPTNTPQCVANGTDQTAGRGYVDGYAVSSTGYDLVNSQVDAIGTWAVAQKVPPFRVISTEDGSHGDYTGGGAFIAGATTATRANLALAIQQRRLANGVMANARFHYDVQIFGITDASYVFEPALVVAAGLTPTNSFETETNTLIAAISSPPSAYRQALMNATIKMLKDAGIWSKLAALYLRGDTDQMVSLNWKNPAITVSALAGTVQYANATSGNGRVLSCDGTNTIGLGVNDNTSPMTQNSQAGGVKRLTASPTSTGIDLANPAFGTPMVDMTFAPAVGWRGAGGTVAASGTAAPALHDTQLVHGGVSRTSSASYTNYVDGSAVETISIASAALSGNQMALCQFNGPPLPAGQFSVAWVASGLTDAEMAQMRTITEFYDNAF